jgi:hypothetical protein
MMPTSKVLFRKLGCLALLAAFAYEVAGDAITDAVSPHDGDCQVCVMVAHQMLPGDSVPALPANFGEIVVVAEGSYSPVFCIGHPVHLNRGPPAA